jgi:5-guanidino-2-oxopentanoate decarboxylase
VRAHVSAAQSSVGCYVAQLLAANGIDTVFGIPGVHNLELYRGLEASGMRHVLVRHEQGAGFAADGYARESGRAAAAFVISGPGVSNILTALAQAFSDSVPLLVIASTPVRASLGKRWGLLHELTDQRGMVAKVLDVAYGAQSDMQVRDHLRAAFAALRAARPRPAYLEIPLDVLAQPTQLRAERFAAAPAPARPPAAQIREAAALLAGAARPLVIAGGGARSAGAELRALVEALDAYLVTSAAGKGLLAEQHPANLGASLQFRDTQERIARADVVLAVGTELSETDAHSTTKLAIGGALIRVDIDPAKLADQYAPRIAIDGDARVVLGALAELISQHAGWRSAEGEATLHRARLEAQFDAASEARAGAVRALREALPDDGMVFSDMTQIAYLGNYAFAADRPGLWHHPSGYGTLGYALPAALGAKVAAPARAIVALVGDFGLQFTLPELMTAIETHCSLPIVVWNNGGLGQIRDDMVAAGIAPVAIAAHNPDFMALAAAYGARGVQARSAGALGRIMREALQEPRPTIIELPAAEFLPR